ncbi:ATP-dependent Clp protease proteolytic subunit [Pseudoxanthomonas dokdonensis]|uniref:ATP-dependent Clp protease proteolytic subunit n=1 Tax=Pseudoxanthomonas dokdonensis TaxID=344882 RepID=UPI00070AEC77|nr:ATP-dependent Clp protease proteolytic subunit [Pseudoxanthomonas dokdonensis]
MSLGILATLFMYSAVITWQAAGSTEAAPPAEPVMLTLQGDTLVYRGEINADAVARVADLLVQQPGVAGLAIDSPGGSIDAGMDLGELVRQHGLDVEVMGSGCASSCANYVFAAADRKSIKPGALVIWHGSAIQKGFDDLDSAPGTSVVEDGPAQPNIFQRWYARHVVQKMLRQYVKRIRHRQADFYRELGIDARVTVIGQDLGCKCNWTLLPADMAAFGIEHVQAPPAYGMPGYSNSSNWSLIRLADHPDYLQKTRK